MLNRLIAVLLVTFTLNAQSVLAGTVLVMGDSLSAGYGIDERDGWVALLAKRLEDRGAPLDVINASISGDTTSGGLARLPDALTRHRPDIVVLELGGNDALRGQSLKNIRKNLSTMVQLVKASGGEVLLLGMRIPTNYGARYTQRFFESFAQVANEHDTALVPFFLEGVATEPDLMQSDGIHPNTAAQAIMLDHIWPALEPLLP